ncbi:MAG: L-2-amino-thiazoline-4-carboxylic acid hydrolase [Spirochaetaceae bacterium]|nr:L-2-amino-thiazoline-4-carboxylic acid hydrolase [Spirochaetaceae bacterium]
MIKNIPNKVDEAAEVNRAQIEHRATWMALIYDELKKTGADAQAILRRAIRRCGSIHGDAIKKKCGDAAGNAAAADCSVFCSAFLSALVVKTFDMRPIDAQKDSLFVDFHYCPLVTAWQKLNINDAGCALLCDIAMEGDRGIADAMGLKLELPETIAAGNDTCKLRFKKAQ